MRAYDSFCIMFIYLFFCIAGTLVKIQTPALVNKQRKAKRSLFTSSYRPELCVIREATSKPFLTQPSNANVYSPRSSKMSFKPPKKKKGCNSFGREHRPSNNPYVLIVQSTEL
ncbi:hypothetical protein AMELA_G00268600 [Ameiurus melas]|uniref:Uncharacterized protein n=1 Tax=Ameiurus melas TaxID=219545 RepID=A0A7J5ZMX3_AMEME|nr:hypothetical protein AMELA_G00268600 [Ameiurus melas]